MGILRVMGIIILSVLLVGFVNWGFFHPPARPSELEEKIVGQYDKYLSQGGNVDPATTMGNIDPKAAAAGARKKVAGDNGLTVEELDVMIEKARVWNAYAREHPEVIDKSVIKRPDGESGDLDEHGH